MSNFKELSENVIKWANDKNLLQPENHKSQFLKFIEESGELAQGILKSHDELISDSFGDVLVTLIILAKQLDYDLVECLETAYNEIKDRTGETVGGTFIKENKA